MAAVVAATTGAGVVALAYTFRRRSNRSIQVGAQVAGRSFERKRN